MMQADRQPFSNRQRTINVELAERAETLDATPQGFATPCMPIA